MAADCNLEATEDTKRTIEKEGGECLTVKADVSEATDCQNIVGTCIQAFGRLDILHNNVGITSSAGPVELAEIVYREVSTPLNAPRLIISGLSTPEVSPHTVTGRLLHLPQGIGIF